MTDRKTATQRQAEIIKQLNPVHNGELGTIERMDARIDSLEKALAWFMANYAERERMTERELDSADGLLDWE